ncbi:hypothetical protein LOD99_13229 [Oopsacas minuta]|uniref:TRAF-type domain-containing protein n=1 Tax=Oopsacas minuta TaxID=111878 RepID=A0AAV7JB72_9METZ|nr:hypothetical protein LOD99_13229 [Oopsacas minuta]
MATNLPATSSPPKNVRCHLCNAYVKPASLTRHLNQFCPARPKPGQQISPGTCPHCLASISISSMETHLLHACPKLTVPCPFCRYRFQYIEQHLRKKHHDKERTKQYQQLRDPPDPYLTSYSSAVNKSYKYSDLFQTDIQSNHSCPICHTYMHDKKLRSHVKSHFKILCPFCKSRFNKSGLFTHLLNKCIPKNVTPSSAGVMKCNACKKQDSVTNIAKHLTVSHLTLCCPICSGTLGAKRVTSHLNQCSVRNSSPGASQSPLLQGVFQKFREFEDDFDTPSDSESLTDDSSDYEELIYDYETNARCKGNYSGSHHQSKPFFAPFIDPSDSDYVLLPTDNKKRGKKGGYPEDLVSFPYVSMGQKISCPICNDDCPLRMMGRHMTENHITHKCPICSKQLAHSSFKVHLEECLGRYGAKQVKGRPTYLCPYCSETKCHSVREISTHIHRTHRQLTCPFCQDSYGPNNFSKHVNKCAKLSVMSAQLFQDHPSLDPEVIQLYQQLEIESSEESSYSEEDIPAARKQISSASLSNRSYANTVQTRYESQVTCLFCNYQCRDVLLENHIAECRNIPAGMQVVSINNLLGLRIN